MTRRRVLGLAAQPDAIVRLQHKFEYPERKLDLQSVSTAGGGGGVPTILVAASDARPETFDSAPYQCDGTDDDVQIQAAIDEILALGGGRLVFSEGTFNTADLAVNGDVHFLGFGTKLVFPDDARIQFGIGTYMSRWEGIEFNRPIGQSTGFFDGRGDVSNQPLVIITGCWFEDIEADYVIGNKAINTFNKWIIVGNYFTNIVLHNGGGFNKSAIFLGDEGGSRDAFGIFNDNYIDGVTKITESGDEWYIIHSQSTSAIIATGNYIVNATTLTDYFDGNVHASHNMIEKVGTPGDHVGVIADHDLLINVSVDDHHNEAHTAASHSDQGATGAELETLTDGSNADALHDHLLGDGSELTIAAGVITVTTGFHTVDTQDDDATDELDTINGGATGQLLVLKSAADARDPTVTDGTGNIVLAGGAGFTLSDTDDTITLLYDGASWVELSRSDNS